MKALFKIIGGIEETLCCACTAVMVTLAFANVIGRYVLHSSISFTEEIVCGLFVLLSMMGTSIAIKQQTHLGLSILADRLSLKAQKILAVGANLLGVAASAGLVYLGWQMVMTQIRLGSITATLQWPAWVYGIALPVGGLFMTIRFLEVAVCKLYDREVL